MAMRNGVEQMEFGTLGVVEGDMANLAPHRRHPLNELWGELDYWTADEINRVNEDSRT